ncbi:glycosyltransferase family 9 protein [Streptomyces sp. NPDC001796]|uniref:glycosyltransferase family 9 protein n=1 Tax=Streptomyces sp. NPDC001796 TaxID=3364609 RepID=UPI0036B6E06F
MKALVVRLGGFGGVLLTGPAVRAVATRARHVTVLCGPRGAPAARLLPHADDVLVAEGARQGADPSAEGEADTDRLLRHLCEGSYDLALELTPLHRRPLPVEELLRTARVPRVGAVGQDSPARRPQGRPDHEAEAALQAAAGLGFSLRDGDDGRLRVVPSPDTAGLTGNGSYVVVHPGAGVPNRAWDPDGCAQAVALLADAGHRVVVTGGPHETALTSYVSGGTAVDLGGRTDARTLAGVVRAADVVVTGSTAPAQLAATGTPVLSLRSPVDPRRAPYGVPGLLLGDETGFREDTRVHPGLNEITAHDVLHGLRKLLREGA